MTQIVAPPLGRNAHSGASLAKKVQRADRPTQLLMYGLMAPALLFLCAFFVLPIGFFLFNSVDNPEIPSALPGTLERLERWQPTQLPPENAYATLANELAALGGSTEAALLGRRLNYNIPGFRGLILGTAARVETQAVESYKAHLTDIDERWGEVRYWATIKNQGSRFTLHYLLAALDLHYATDGSIQRVPAEDALFLELLGRTFWISFVITAVCLLIGFPVAVTLASASPGVVNLLLIFVLVPFWTSLLVRTTAWVILLQNTGLVNQSLMFLGVLEEPLQLIFNRTGLYIAMVHILSPFMILPLYSVLKGISRDHLRAAASLGAPPVTVFRRIYLPQTMPGVAAGCTLVFVLSLGFYITPALVGGPADQMIGYFIAHFTNRAVNWGMASALGAVLLITVAAGFAVVGRLIGFQRLKVQ